MHNKTYILLLNFAIAICLNGYSQTINMPTSNATYYVVDGKFYDNGGSGGQYSTSYNSTVTFYPAISTMKVSIRFNSFVVETATCAQDYDRLFIHNGNSTAATAMHPTTNSGGYWTGCAANAMSTPQTFTSTAADGSLTIRFKSDGGTVAAGWDADIILTGSPCGGTFYDIGGPSNPYTNNLNYSYTITPPAGQYISLNFTSFATESGTCAQDFDRLFLHDGNSTGATALHPTTNSGGFWTGCAANVMSTPQTFVSTAADGTLTFRFKSDGGTTGAGWAATITCNSLTPCSGSPTAGTTTISSSSGASGVNYTLSNTGATTGVGISYQWQSSTNGSTWNNIAGATSTSYVTSSSTYSYITYYRLIVSCSNSGQSSTSNTVSYTVTSWNQPAGTSSANLVACAGTIYDHAGTSDYASSQNSTFTICPSSAGQFVRIAFTSWNLESNFDYLSIFDGNSTSADMIVGSSFSATSPGTVTATTTNSTGCLTLKFFSDGATVRSGFQGTISCVATGATPLASASAQDCNGGVTICSNENFNYQSNGAGNFNDANSGLGNRGCLNNYAATPNGSAEHQSVWGFFSPSSSGTLGMTLDPAGSSSTDYDWAIWGPFSTISCPPTTLPIRCSAASASNSTGAMTGMGNGASDTEEGSGGNGWVSTLNVIAGEKYVIMVDNWNATSAPLTLSWQLSGGASLSCVPLPIQLISFYGKAQENSNSLEWITGSEVNNDYFTIEKSSNAIDFYPLTIVNGSGNSNQAITYSIKDTNPYKGLTYYRLLQTDYNGETTASVIISVNNDFVQNSINNIHPNPTTESVNFDFTSVNSGMLNIQVIDYTGKIVVEDNVFINEGRTKLTSKMNSLKAGIYFLKVGFETTGFSSVTKIIKQ